jgi:hypothetical protein
LAALQQTLRGKPLVLLQCFSNLRNESCAAATKVTEIVKLSSDLNYATANGEGTPLVPMAFN